MKILKRKNLAVLLAFSLLASLLPLGAQPALAGTAPQTLCVGSTTISTGYWTSSDGGTTWISPANEPEGNSYIHYNGQGTLELHNVTIQGGSNTVSAPYGSGIYALSRSGQPVALTIKLIGTNTITGYYGIFLNAEIDASSYGTNATLTITGENNGSLGVSGSDHGIYVKSGTGDASLNIEKATVTSSTNGNSAAGVYVMSSSTATNSPQLSLAVNGGSLTASASEGNDGIQFYVGNSSASATTSLTVSENAIVDARNGGISASGISETLPTPKPTGENSSGIVFDGSTGTVYGTVELQNDLTINEGETLTVPDGSSLSCNGNLTNNGTILASGGTVTGSLSGGSTVTTPNITVQPSDNTVTEGQGATFTVEASAGSETPTYQWQQSTDSGSNWTNIESATSASYTTDATTTSMSGYQYRCVVKSASGVGVISNAATLTVNQSVSPTSYSISAYVAPAGAGTVTVNGSTSPVSVEADSAVNLVAAANEGYRFVEWQEDGTQVSTNASYSFSADGNRTLTARFEKVYTVTVSSTAGGTATADKTTAAAGETVTLTATPNSGYHFAGWNVVSGTVTIQDKQFIMPANDVGIQAIFARNTSPTIPPTVSEETTDAIKAADPGETVTVDLSSGSTTLDKDVFETLAGRDVTLVIDLGDGVSWTVKGSDISEDADFTDIDMGVTMGSDGIPVDVVNAITGERSSVQITLAHNGAFGFTMTLTAPVGAENAGYWANLYHFNEEASTMTFETAAQIGSDGSVSLAFSHASQYAIVIDDHNHGVVTLPFTDVSEGDWFYEPVCYVYENGLMTGTSADTFEPNTPLSRAMLVAVLHRLEGSPAASGGDFTDVADGDWYAQAVNWAASVGVVNGTGDGNFSPNTAITREQLAAILMNYAQYKGQDVSARATLDTYNDATAISSWANDVMSWAVAEGLLTGVTNDQLQPQGNATRAQVAAILQRFLSE